jgi:hypothetical protein
MIARTISQAYKSRQWISEKELSIYLFCSGEAIRY